MADISPELAEALRDPNVQAYFVDLKVRQAYGYLAWALDDPELAPILRQAAQEGWDEARLQGAVQQTDWWQNLSASQRDWLALEGTDPATAERQREIRRGEIDTLTSQLGVALPGETVSALVDQSLALGWSADELRRGVLAEVDFTAGVDFGGLVGSQIAAVKGKARDWMLPLSDDAARAWAAKILTGQVGEDSLDGYFRDTAAAAFPSLAGYISEGWTPRQLMEPHIQTAAQLLEINPDMIDLRDSRYAPMLDVTGKDGTRRPMTLTETAEFVRGLPEWGQTRNAQQSAAELALHISETFGKVA